MSQNIPEAILSVRVSSAVSLLRLTCGSYLTFIFTKAYDDVMKILCITATCLSVVPILCSLIMPDWYLGDKQNAVDSTDLRGERSDDGHSIEERQ